MMPPAITIAAKIRYRAAPPENRSAVGNPGRPMPQVGKPFSARRRHARRVATRPGGLAACASTSSRSSRRSWRASLAESLLGKAIDGGHVDLHVHDLRDWANDRHRSVDDESFGGGPGMVLKPEPLFAAVESLDPGRRPRSRDVTRGPAARSGGGGELATEVVT